MKYLEIDIYCTVKTIIQRSGIVRDSTSNSLKFGELKVYIRGNLSKVPINKLCNHRNWG